MAKPDPQLLERERYPRQFELSTRFQDLDPNNHLNNVAIAAMFEDMRVRFDTSLNLSAPFRNHGLRVMVASLGLEYLNEGFYPDPVTGFVGCLSVGRTSWNVGAILTQESTVFAVMRATIVCVSTHGPSPLPASFCSAMQDNMIRLDDPAR
jgi:acyl-CoA thioester hydrolase